MVKKNSKSDSQTTIGPPVGIWTPGDVLAELPAGSRPSVTRSFVVLACAGPVWPQGPAKRNQAANDVGAIPAGAGAGGGGRNAAAGRGAGGGAYQSDWFEFRNATTIAP